MLGSPSHLSCPLKAMGISSVGKRGPAFQGGTVSSQRPVHIRIPETPSWGYTHRVSEQMLVPAC